MMNLKTPDTYQAKQNIRPLIKEQPWKVQAWKQHVKEELKKRDGAKEHIRSTK